VPATRDLLRQLRKITAEGVKKKGSG